MTTNLCGEPSNPGGWFRCTKPAGHTRDRHHVDFPGGSFTWGYVPGPEEETSSEADHPAVDLIDRHLMAATHYYGPPTTRYADAVALADALTAAGLLTPAGGRPDILRTVVRPRLVELLNLIDGTLNDVDPAPADPQALIDEVTLRVATADGSSERVEAIRDLLAGWYAAWPVTAVTDPHEPIAWQMESLIAGAESRAARRATQPGRHVLSIDSDGGWSIDHPDPCVRMTPDGPGLVCNVEDLAREQLTGMRWTPGRYEVKANEIGDRLLILDRLHDDQCTACGCWCHDDDQAAAPGPVPASAAVPRDQLAAWIRRAVANPGSIAGPRRGPSLPTDHEGHADVLETVAQWSTRAVLRILDVGGWPHCERCDQPIQLDDAYDPPLPGVGLWAHAGLCPRLAGADEQPVDLAEYCRCAGGGARPHRYGTGPVCEAVRKADARRAELAEVGRRWIAERESSPAHDHATGFPLFAPTASVGVHTFDGFQTWTGAQWNAHVRAATRGGNAVLEHLTACPDTVCTTTCPAAGPVEV